MSQNDPSLKRKVFSGIIWRFGERIGAQLITFIVSVILARILSPDDYGVIALVVVFITIANIFVSSGFGTALIQKKDADNEDFSSVFYFSVTFSIILYIALFFFAPVVASFYEMPILCPVLRVLGFQLILAGVNSVQQAYVSKHMLFKKFFISTLIGTIGSGIVGIVMALNGFGVWALVGQYLFNATVDTVVLWIVVKWRPTLSFSFQKLKGLFSFGSKMLFSSLLFQVSNELANLIIGKYYTSADLGYFSKGKQIPNLLTANITVSIGSVLFPAMAKVQTDKDRVRQIARQSIKVTSFVMTPLLLGLMVVAEPLVLVMLTEKWKFAIPYLQLFCLYYVVQPIQTANQQAIKAIGRSDIIAKLEIIKRTIYIVMLIISVPYGVYAIAVTNVIASFMRSFINAYPNKKLIGYSYLMQLKDIAPAAVLSSVMALAVWLIGTLLPFSHLVNMIIQILAGVVIYVLLAWLLKMESFNYVVNILKEYIKPKRNEDA